MKQNWTTKILWLVYLCLLGVLLPHTAWAFESMEPAGQGGKITAWVAAIAFEASIAVLTHKLAKHMERVGRRKGRERFAFMYLNAFAFGLAAATLISALANLAHAVQFGTTLKIFTDWGIPQGVYSVTFGGILPVVSLVFARVLSNVTESEDAPNPELEKANTTIRELHKQIKETEGRVKGIQEEANTTIRKIEEQAKATEAQARVAIQSAEARAAAAEGQANAEKERLNTALDLFQRLFTENKRERIVNIKRQWPALSGNAIAVIAETSPAYVSETLKDIELIDVTGEYQGVVK